MDRQVFEQLIEKQIQTALNALFRLHVPSPVITEVRVRSMMEKVGQVAFTQGRLYALTSLMTADDVARHYGISARRARALIKNRHERFGVGWQVPGTKLWLITPEELDGLRPDERYRAK